MTSLNIKEKYMPRIVKCKRCDIELVNKEDRYKFSNKTYCKRCYEILRLDADEYKALMKYICKECFEIDAPTSLILKQVKDFHSRNINYGAMTYTLWYCKEILDFKFNVKFGVALIDTYYDEAKDYYSKQEEKRQVIEKMNVKENVKIVKRNNTENSKSKLLVDLGSIL